MTENATRRSLAEIAGGSRRLALTPGGGKRPSGTTWQTARMFMDGNKSYQNRAMRTR